MNESKCMYHRERERHTHTAVDIYDVERVESTPTINGPGLWNPARLRYPAAVPAFRDPHLQNGGALNNSVRPYVSYFVSILQGIWQQKPLLSLLQGTLIRQKAWYSKPCHTAFAASCGPRRTQASLRLHHLNSGGL